MKPTLTWLLVITAAVIIGGALLFWIQCRWREKAKARARQDWDTRRLRAETQLRLKWESRRLIGFGRQPDAASV